MNEAEIAIRVLNGTDRQGLAGTAATTLEGRNFEVVSVANSNRTYDGVVRISFGAEGLVKAYTVANHFVESELIYDTRTSGLVDVVLGDRFETTMIRPLLAPELQGETVLTASAQCLPLSLVPAEPAPGNLPDDPFDPDASPAPEEEEEDEPDVEDGEPLD